MNVACFSIGGVCFEDLPSELRLYILMLARMPRIDSWWIVSDDFVHRDVTFLFDGDVPRCMRIKGRVYNHPDVCSISDGSIIVTSELHWLSARRGRALTTSNNYLLGDPHPLFCAHCADENIDVETLNLTECERPTEFPEIPEITEGREGREGGEDREGREKHGEVSPLTPAFEHLSRGWYDHSRVSFMDLTRAAASAVSFVTRNILLLWGRGGVVTEPTNRIFVHV